MVYAPCVVYVYLYMFAGSVSSHTDSIPERPTTPDLQQTSRLMSRRIQEPLDMTNPEFEQHLKERSRKPPTDFIKTNMVRLQSTWEWHHPEMPHLHVSLDLLLIGPYYCTHTDKHTCPVWSESETGINSEAKERASALTEWELRHQACSSLQQSDAQLYWACQGQASRETGSPAPVHLLPGLSLHDSGTPWCPGTAEGREVSIYSCYIASLAYI